MKKDHLIYSVVLFSFGWNLFTLLPSEAQIYAQNIAQAQNPTSNQDALQRSAIAYDDNMQKGYEATENREYDQALSYFKIALSHRPEDFYATQAISNVERLLERQNTVINNNLPINNTFTIVLILLFFLVIAIAITSIIISLKVLKVSTSNKSEKELKERKLEQLSLQNEQVILQPNREQKKSEKTKFKIEKIPQKPVGKLAERIKPEIEKKEENYQDNTQKLISQLDTAKGNEKIKIIWSLAADADSRAIEPLLDIMFRGNSQEKTLVLEAISQIASKSLKPINQALIMSLQDEQGQVRKNALRDVTKLYELITEIQPVILQAACDDPDPEVREIAIFSLNKLGIKTNALSDSQKVFDQDISATLITDDDQDPDTFITSPIRNNP